MSQQRSSLFGFDAEEARLAPAAHTSARATLRLVIRGLPCDVDESQLGASLGRVGVHADTIVLQRDPLTGARAPAGGAHVDLTVHAAADDGAAVGMLTSGKPSAAAASATAAKVEALARSERARVLALLAAQPQALNGAVVCEAAVISRN